MQNLDELISQISSNPLFLKLKNVVENLDGWHDHEDVFSHSLRTANIARKEVEGGFILNPEAKDLFLKWMGEDTPGLKRRDLAVLIALLHDCGKILSFKEGEKVSTLIIQRPEDPNQTLCSGHEFWGGEIVVKEILKKTGLDEKVIRLTGDVVKQHAVFSSEFFADKENWSAEQIMNDVKVKAEGLYKESLFNMYCDGYIAQAFLNGKARIEELFNSPSLYTSREYFIP